MHKKSEQTLDPQIGNNLKVAIVQSEWYSEYSDLMVDYCTKELIKYGVEKDQINLTKTPGAVEIPLACKLLAKQNKYDCIICFGAILKGETYHFEMVADAANQGMNKVSLEYEIPVIQEVLALYTLDQLKARTADSEYNKGVEAAHAALKMCKITQELKN